jgi:hypothetical protein
VIVWLGETGDDGKLAIDTLQGLVRASQSGGEDMDKMIDSALEAINGLEGTAALTSLLSFLDRPWWNRLWTVQEYAFAKQVVFACGDLAFPWEILLWWSGIVTVKHHPNKWLHERLDYLKVANLAGSNGVYAKTYFRVQVQRKVAPQNLGHILKLVDSATCTDPRDRIYGIQGLASDGDSFGPPDYTISVSELYIKVARIMVETHQNLKVLNYRRPECLRTGTFYSKNTCP